jgi:Domain of unknown function (DUF4424)
MAHHSNRRMLKPLFCLLLLVLIFPSQVYANDSTARVGAGGITLLKNDDIRMLQEELEMSTGKIKVRYRFINDSDHDITTTVAFPLPEYKWDAELVDFKEAIAYRKFSSFKNRVNGKPVATKRMRKAMSGSTDITDALRKLGLNDQQIFDTFGDSTTDGTKLSQKQQNGITELILKSSGWKTTGPDWVVSETIYWEQSFPKGQELEVVHEYIPNRGNAPNYIYSTNELQFLKPVPKAINHYSEPGEKSPKEACLDDSTVKAVQHRVKAVLGRSKETQAGVHLYDVEYILGTGKNWKGPIASFTLRIVKDTPDQLISLCFPGKPKQINSKTVEFNQTNYTPQDRLVVYFISVGKN